MFRHNQKSEKDLNNKKNPPAVEEKSAPILSKIDNSDTPKKSEEQSLRELLEKNLKWSQIIYEQNRKINNKLMWSAIGGWVRLFLIVAPLIWAIWFLPPLVSQFMSSYGNLLGGKSGANNSGSLEQMMKLLPLDPAKQEQLKALLK